MPTTTVLLTLDDGTQLERTFPDDSTESRRIALLVGAKRLAGSRKAVAADGSTTYTVTVPASQRTRLRNLYDAAV